MNFAELFASPPEAVIEIEETYVKFLVPEGKTWQLHYFPLQGTDVYKFLRKQVPLVLGSIQIISIVLWNESNSRILPFPSTMTENEIIQHLDLKREDYFGSAAGMVFAIKPLGFIDKTNREYLVSSTPRVYFNLLQNLFTELGYNLNRITTSLEAAIGRFLRLSEKPGPAASAYIISLGYSQVQMVVMRQGEVKTMRTALTGSVKELETRLATSLKLKTEKIEEFLSGKVENPDPKIVEIIQQNIKELLTRISLFLASFRSMEKDQGEQTIYLSFPCIELKGLKEMLELSFSMPVKSLDEGTSHGGAQHPWLEGALHPDVVNLLPPRLLLFHYILTPRVTWLLAVFFFCFPWAFLKMNHARLKEQIRLIQVQEERSRQYIQREEMIKAQHSALQQVSELARGEMPKAITAAGLLVEIAKKIPANVRISNLDYSPDPGSLVINGISVDTSTAISFWETLKQIPWLRDPKISLLQGSSEFSKGFSISAGVVP